MHSLAPDICSPENPRRGPRPAAAAPSPRPPVRDVVADGQPDAMEALRKRSAAPERRSAATTGRRCRRSRPPYTGASNATRCTRRSPLSSGWNAPPVTASLRTSTGSPRQRASTATLWPTTAILGARMNRSRSPHSHAFARLAEPLARRLPPGRRPAALASGAAAEAFLREPARPRLSRCPHSFGAGSCPGRSSARCWQSSKSARPGRAWRDSFAPSSPARDPSQSDRPED